MTDLQFDAQFEQRLARQLIELGETAVRPFDAGEIARDVAARSGGRARGLGLALLPRSWRPVLLVALLALGLIGAGILGGFIKLPNNNIAPNPSFQPFSPPPTLETPAATADASSSPFASPGVSGSPTESSPPFASSTPEPTGTDSAPTASPTLVPTDSPTAAPTPTLTPTPSPISEGPEPVNKVVAVTTGDNHDCALADDGRVFCWGSNDVGQLGYGSTDGDYRNYGTVPVVGIDDATAIDAGLRFTCAIRADHSVWCWGEDPGSDAVSALPFQVPGIDDATAVTAGGQFACVLRSSGQIGCWGNGQAGQLGNGVYENNSGVPTPRRVLGIDNAIAVSAGWGHACALLADRTVECWGANGDGASVYGSLGDGSSDVRRATPAPVSGLDNVKAIQVGGWTSCATRLDGTVWCWGYGQQGEMGDGNFGNSSVPTQVALIDDARLLALGDHTACVSRADDSVWCWGQTNWIGQDNPGSEDPGKPRQGNKPIPRVVTALATARHCLLIDGRGQTWDWSFGTNPTPERRPVGP